jgi:hypothetical protein
MSEALRLATSADVFQGLANRYHVCATAFSLGSSAERAAAAEVQAARCALRDAVAKGGGVRHASVAPAMEALRVALAAPAADAADEAARVAADIAFLRADSTAQDSDSKETWLAAQLYVCTYLAANHREAATSMLPQIATLSGRPAAELFWDMPARRWLVREPGGVEIKAPAPAALRCARVGCPERGTKWCAACRRVRYCGAACQTAHWKAGHKAACGAA